MDQQLIEKVVTKFGADKQILKAIEEMAELTTELARKEAGRGMNINVLEEIADVCIMMEQLKFIFGPELVDCQIGVKLKRLSRLIEPTT